MSDVGQRGPTRFVRRSHRIQYRRPSITSLIWRDGIATSMRLRQSAIFKNKKKKLNEERDFSLFSFMHVFSRFFLF
jgi:hypothetical protein